MNLENKYRPTTIDGFAGLTAAKILMKKLIAKPYESSWLFRGDSGSGKTELSFMVSRAIGAEIIHLPSRMCDMEAVDRLIHSLQFVPLFGNGWRAIIVDEADQITTAAQHSFLSMLDGTATPEKTIFFFTANEPEPGKSDRLEARFVGRCRYIPFNGKKELDAGIEYLTSIWKKETRRAVPDIRELLLENNGNIRAALNAMELELMAPGTTLYTSEPTASRPVTSITDPQKGGKRKMLYTIGYQKLSVKRFAEIVEGLAVTTIIDCRTTPYSRVPGFGTAQLTKKFGDRYMWKGDILGGRKAGINEAGIKWLTNFMKDGKQTPLLLCVEEAPGSCHRHQRIAVPLLQRTGIDAIHICDKEIFRASELQRAFDEDDEYEYETLAV